MSAFFTRRVRRVASETWTPTDQSPWLKRHPRFHVHFTPTSSSWLNLVERWFRDLTDKRIRRGVFKSVRDLVAAIDDYVDRHNDQTEGG